MTSRSNGQWPTSNAEWSFDLLLDDMWPDELAWHCGVDLCLLACEVKLVEWAWKLDLVSRLVRQQTDDWRYESWTSDVAKWERTSRRNDAVTVTYLSVTKTRQWREAHSASRIVSSSSYWWGHALDHPFIHSSRHKMPGKKTSIDIALWWLCELWSWGYQDKWPLSSDLTCSKLG